MGSTPLSLVTLLLLAGCVSSPVNDSDQQAHILFMDDGRVRGFSSCNEYMGEYLVEGQSLVFGRISRTQRACEDNLGEEGKTVAVFKVVQ
jgi:heat shock protein HslJ